MKMFVPLFVGLNESPFVFYYIGVLRSSRYTNFYLPAKLSAISISNLIGIR